MDTGVDASYARLFGLIVEGMEKLVEAGNGPVLTRVRDYLRRAATQVFSNLAHADPDFDFRRVLEVVDPDQAEDLEEIVKRHVDELLRQFTRMPDRELPPLARVRRWCSRMYTPGGASLYADFVMNHWLLL